MKIFLDFDRTLYDLDNLLADLKKVFEAHGVIAEDFEISRSCFAHWDGDNKLQYTIERHTERFPQLDETSVNFIIAGFNNLLKGGEAYVFEDVQDFLNAVRAHELFILTFGDDESQKKKIFGSGLGDIVNDVLVTSTDKGKWQEISERVDPAETAFFIDDNVKYFIDKADSGNNIKGVHLVRTDNGKKKCEGCAAEYHIDNLSELKNIIMDHVHL